jgi:hypothetical protein
VLRLKQPVKLSGVAYDLGKYEPQITRADVGQRARLPEDDRRGHGRRAARMTMWHALHPLERRWR